MEYLLSRLIIGFILNTTEYNENLPFDSQPPSALFGIKIIITLTPLISIFITIFFFSKYPLYGKRLSDVKEQVAMRHAERNKELVKILINGTVRNETVSF